MQPNYPTTDTSDDDDADAVTDDELAEEFREYDERTAEYAATARLTPNQRARVLAITEADRRDAFSVSIRRVRRVLHQMRTEIRNAKSMARADRYKSAVQSVVTLADPVRRGTNGATVARQPRAAA